MSDEEMRIPNTIESAEATFQAEWLLLVGPPAGGSRPIIVQTLAVTCSRGNLPRRVSDSEKLPKRIVTGSPYIRVVTRIAAKSGVRAATSDSFRPTRLVFSA
jgi:hypothetical protein